MLNFNYLNLLNFVLFLPFHRHHVIKKFNQLNSPFNQKGNFMILNRYNITQYRTYLEKYLEKFCRKTLLYKNILYKILYDTKFYYASSFSLSLPLSTSSSTIKLN